MIQYVYAQYGRERAAQVANVITYRPRSALREMAKVAGLSPGHADALTKWVDRWGRDGNAFAAVKEENGAGPRLGDGPRAKCSTTPATSASTRAAW